MNYNLTYSLRMALAEYMPEFTSVRIMEDGIKLDELTKPYATVEYFDEAPLLLAAGRTSYSEDYHYQIGIFARTINERHTLESKMRGILRRPDGVPFYIYDKNLDSFVRTAKRVHITDGGFTPMANDDATEESANHRGYFDVTIEIIRDVGDDDFTQ